MEAGLNSQRTKWRSDVLERLNNALKSDSRIAGVVLVGSGAVSFRDDESDIDIVAPVAHEHDAALVFRDWKQRIGGLLDARYLAETAATEAEHLLVVLCDGLLEVDVSFPALGTLKALEPRWRVLWERSAEVTQRLAAPATHTVALEQQYQWTLNRGVHRVTYAARALRRGQVWKATLQLDELRRFALQLACLDVFGNSNADAHADELPSEALALFGQSFPQQANVNAVRESLEVCAKALLVHAAALDQRYGVDYSRVIEPLLSEHLQGEWNS